MISGGRADGTVGLAILAKVEKLSLLFVVSSPLICTGFAKVEIVDFGSTFGTSGRKVGVRTDITGEGYWNVCCSRTSGRKVGVRTDIKTEATDVVLHIVDRSPDELEG